MYSIIEKSYLKPEGAEKIKKTIKVKDLSLIEDERLEILVSRSIVEYILNLLPVRDLTEVKGKDVVSSYTQRNDKILKKLGANPVYDEWESKEFEFYSVDELVPYSIEKIYADSGFKEDGFPTDGTVEIEFWINTTNIRGAIYEIRSN